MVLFLLFKTIINKKIICKKSHEILYEWNCYIRVFSESIHAY